MADTLQSWVEPAGEQDTELTQGILIAHLEGDVDYACRLKAQLSAAQEPAPASVRACHAPVETSGEALLPGDYVDRILEVEANAVLTVLIISEQWLKRTGDATRINDLAQAALGRRNGEPSLIPIYLGGAMADLTPFGFGEVVGITADAWELTAVAEKLLALYARTLKAHGQARLAALRHARRAATRAEQARLDAEIDRGQAWLDTRERPREGSLLRFGEHTYRLLEQIGEGAFAVVWRAHRLGDDGGVYAVKILREQLLTDRRNRERFLKGARSMRKHGDVSGVVPVVDEVVDAPGWVGFVMPFFDAGDLGRWLETPRDPKMILRVLASIARALAILHGMKVVHRDIRPGNILLRGSAEGPVACLADFDLVFDPTLDGDRTFTLSRPQSPFSAPEERLFAEADSAVDVYRFAAVAVSALDGEKTERADAKALPERARELGRQPAFAVLAEQLELALSDEAASRPPATVLAEALEASATDEAGRFKRPGDRHELLESGLVLRYVPASPAPLWVGERPIGHADLGRPAAGHERDDHPDERPLTGRTLKQAQAICDRLSARDGLRPVYGAPAPEGAHEVGYRLPTRSEWLRFAAGDEQPHRWGLRWPDGEHFEWVDSRGARGAGAICSRSEAAPCARDPDRAAVWLGFRVVREVGGGRE